MNTRAVLFLVVIAFSITPYLAAKTTTAEDTPKKGRRAKLRAERKEREEKRKKNMPTKRFDDGKRGSVHYTYQHMSFPELEEAKQQLIAEKSYDIAIEYVKQQIAIATDAEAHQIPDLLLEMADLLYAKKDYEKAWKAYAHWITQYPGANKKIASEIQKIQHDLGTEIMQVATLIQGTRELGETELIICTQSEHASFRAVDAAYRCTQDPDRDQTQTHAAIELADKFLQNKDRFKKHRRTVEAIRTACYEKLIRSELGICSFYRLQGNHEVVEHRLAIIEQDFGEKFPQTKNSVVAYRAQHYGSPDAETAEIPATLITQEDKKPKGHAADRF